MDWSTVHTPARPPAPPKLELVTRYWAVRGPSARTFSCGLYRTKAGLEVRSGYGDDLLASQRVLDATAGQQLADDWLQMLRERGGFVELPIDEGA